MADLQVTTISGGDTVLQEAAVTAFKQSLRGQLIAPSDDGYTEARQVWNGNIDRRPGLIARNDIGQEADEGADQVRAAYGANYQRLAQLKQKYDPTNLFRHNQNIKSAAR